MKLDKRTIAPITMALYGRQPFEYELHGWALDALISRAAVYARRYKFLRERDLNTIMDGGVFSGRSPENIVLNGDHLDAAVDAQIYGVISNNHA